jgi:hypothetical protein
MSSGRGPISLRIHPHVRGRTILTSFRSRRPAEDRGVPLPLTQESAPPRTDDNRAKTTKMKSKPPAEKGGDRARQTGLQCSYPPSEGSPGGDYRQGLGTNTAPGAGMSAAPGDVLRRPTITSWPATSDVPQHSIVPEAGDDAQTSEMQTREMESRPPGPPPRKARHPPPPGEADKPPMFTLEELGLPAPSVPGPSAKATQQGLDPQRTGNDDDDAATTRFQPREPPRRQLPKPRPIEKQTGASPEPAESSGVGDDPSFMASVDGLLGIEDKRVAAEEAAKQRAEEAQRLALARRMVLDAHKSKGSQPPGMAPAPPRRRIRSQVPSPPAKAAAQEPEDSAPVVNTGEISFDVGIPWKDEPITYKLGRQEKESCLSALEEGKRRLIIPVPEGDDEAATFVKSALNKEDLVLLAGRPYYVIDEPFVTGTKTVAMVGDTLHVWPTEMTSHALLQAMRVECDEYEIVKWGKTPILRLQDDERSLVYDQMPENRPRLLYPVPSKDTKHDHNRQVLQAYSAQPVVSIGGRHYYVMNIRSMAEWKLHTANLPNARMAVRDGDMVTPWTGRNMNGYSLFQWPTGRREGSYGKRGAPLRPKQIGACTEEVYESEVAAITEVYENGQATRYLYPMPENIGEMDANQYQAVMLAAGGYINNNQHSPLISIRGRWYLALEAPWMDTRTSTFDGRTISLHADVPKERDLRPNAREATEEITGSMLVDGTQALTSSMVLEENTPIIGLPEDMEARLPIMAQFPENQPRWLQPVGLDEEVQALPTIQAGGDDGDHRFVIFKMQVENSFEVVRIGDVIYAVSHAGRK